MYVIYNPNPVPITYTPDELAIVISDYLEEVKTEFSFKSICSFILDKAIAEGKVKDSHNTQYSSKEISPLSSIEVSRYLWKLIWEKKIFIAFGDNPYAAHYNNDTRFIINQ
ncbi:unknown [Bacteroides sp. CAG:1060]|nr:unknown [Bacteroides sp. CAG:1060]